MEKQDTVKVAREAAQFLMVSAMKGFNNHGYGCFYATCPPMLKVREECRFCPFYTKVKRLVW